MIDAYLAELSAYREAALTSDAASPKLEATASGELLTTVRRVLTQRKASGLATRRPSDSKTRSVILAVTLKDSTAEVVSCDVDDTIVYRIADGGVVNDDVTTGRWSSRLNSDSSGWKVVASNQVGKTFDGEETDACAAAQ